MLNLVCTPKHLHYNLELILNYKLHQTTFCCACVLASWNLHQIALQFQLNIFMIGFKYYDLYYMYIPTPPLQPWARSEL